MGVASKGTVAVSVGFAAALIAGCGSGGSLLTSSQAAQLTRQLDNISTAVQDGDCSAAENDLAQLQTKLNSLGGVNSTLLQNLDQGVGTVQQLTESKCSTSTSTTHTTTHTGTGTSTTETTTSATTTTPSTTTTTLTQTTATSTTGGQGLPTYTETSTTGGSTAAPTTTSGGATSTSTATTTTPSTTSTSPAGGATGF